MTTHFRSLVDWDGGEIESLEDIIPNSPGDLKMLIVGHRPIERSVECGHYLQGAQGQTFWTLMRAYEILNASGEQYEDLILRSHGYGITDLVKVPAAPRQKPTEFEYESGRKRLNLMIEQHDPKVLLFIFKSALRAWLGSKGAKAVEISYGFNEDLRELFGRRVFVSPLPGVSKLNAASIDVSWRSLKQVLKS